MAKRLCILFIINALSSAVLADYLDEMSAQKYFNVDDTRRMQHLLRTKKGKGYGKDWIYMPDGEGNPQVAILDRNSNSKNSRKGSPARDGADTSNLSQSIRYLLYTRSNPTEGSRISLENQNSFKSAQYNEKNPTKIVIHGWMSSGDSSTVQNIKRGYLEKSDVNVIGVDWSNIASSYNYLTPAGEVPNVGAHVAKMIDTLVSTQGARHQDFHIVGHSLGAHIAGTAGKRTSKKVSRVTGLDPAFPGFEYWAYSGADERLDKSSAEYVDVVHTCAGVLGMWNTVGHADFYPNGGSPFQPGCCCTEEYTKSITNEVPFEAVPCNTYDDFQNGRCGSTAVKMGDPSTPDTNGVFYLMTNSSAPYALGPIGKKYSTGA